MHAIVPPTIRRRAGHTAEAGKPFSVAKAPPQSKDDLLRAVGEEAFAVFQQRVAGITDRPIEEWLCAVGREYAKFALDDPGHFEACFVP